MRRFGPIAGWMIFAALTGLALWRWEANGYGTLIWVASALAMSAIRAPFAKRNSSNFVVEKSAVSTERILLGLVFLGGTFLPLVHLATGVFGFADYSGPSWLLAVAVALLIVGLWLFWRSHTDLGRNWSVTTEIHDKQTLVTEGVYSKIRHPMYSAIWLIFLTQPLLIQNWIAGLAGPIAFGIMYFIRVPYEEAMMRERFGAEYEAYMNRSGRLLPI